MNGDFEWDQAKAATNLRKHGVSFEEAIGVFLDPRAITIYDERFADWEDRFFTIGIGGKGRLIAVAHADRSDRIRIISARRATKHEEADYKETRQS